MSYFYGLEGPSKSIDTACSSALVAIHDAVNALRNNECSFAIAGGVNVLARPETFVLLSKAKMLSPEGLCKTFDKDADGYVRGEGCGVLILKKLKDALADKDSILAVIRGSAVNQDGASSALTVPRGPAQQTVMEKVLSQTQISADKIDYVEAHGTGTPLGDPIEVDALGKVYGKAHSEAAPLMLGSVKTNIGHLESAAGIAGIIKVILMMQHKAIPPHLNFKQINPHIDLEKAHIQLPVTLMPWNKNEGIRCAAVSAFGFSGTNAHVILEEAPKMLDTLTPGEKTSSWVCITLSAKTATALEKQIEKLSIYLEQEEHKEIKLEDLAFTLCCCRTHFTYRMAVVISDKEELKKQLQNKTYLLGQINNRENTDVTDQKIAADLEQRMHQLAHAYVNGVTIDWPGIYASTEKTYHKLILPAYPFNHRRFWWNNIDDKSETHSQSQDIASPYTNIESVLHALKMRKISLEESEAIILNNFKEKN